MYDILFCNNIAFMLILNVALIHCSYTMCLINAQYT